MVFHLLLFPICQLIFSGHLSNHQALELFLNHRGPQLSHVFLSHLSRENNDPELAAALFCEHAEGVNISVASRYHESEVFHLNGDLFKTESKDRPSMRFTKHVKPEPDPQQISLFNNEMS